MNTMFARMAAVLVLGLVLLLATTPAIAAPPHRSEEGEPTGLAFVNSLATWLTALWPQLGLPVASWLAADIGGELPLELPPTRETAGGPTADPERGSDLDPNG